jgi:hypothetical protein
MLPAQGIDKNHTHCRCEDYTVRQKSLTTQSVDPAKWCNNEVLLVFQDVPGTKSLYIFN